MLWSADTEGDDPGRFTVLLPPRTSRDHRPRPWYYAQTAVLDRDGRRLFFLSRPHDEPGGLMAWALDGPRPTPLTTPPPTGASCLALRPDGRVLALGLDSGEVALVSADSFSELSRIVPPEAQRGQGVLAVSFAPDGRTLAVGNRDGALHLWDVGDPPSSSSSPDAPRRLLQLPGRHGFLASLAFSPDGRRLASVNIRSRDDRSVEVWDLDALRAELRDLGLSW